MNQQELNEKLKDIAAKVISIDTPAANRIYMPCESENIRDICRFLFADVGARFVIATGIDSDDCFEIIYHFSYDQTGCVINVKAYIRDRENPEVESITPLIPGAEWIEREMHDLLGIGFRNHPRLERLILADDWPDGVYPLRKDAKL
jgi:Ni,Fe-hydrogenase III component G